MDWLQAVFVDPWDHPQGWFAYLALPILGSAALTWTRPRAAPVILAIWPFVSVFLYFGLYICLYGVSSTIGIGVILAWVVYFVVCAATVAVVRSIRIPSRY